MAMVERYINAAKDGHVDILRNATRKDLNTPDEDGMTATLWAARLGKLEALRLIVGRQGDVNHSDYLGLTAIHHAAMQGHIDIVTYLTNWGCNLYALDNDTHSALDLASIKGRDDIVRYLDRVLAQKQAENPKQVMRLREEAVKHAESNIKKYEKLQEAAAKRAEKEKKRIEKDIELQQHQNSLYQQNGHSTDEKKKKSFIKTLTLRVKPKDKVPKGLMTYSDMTGISQTSGPRSGVSKKIQMRRLGSLTPSSAATEFRVSNIDQQGNRTLRSVAAHEGLRGSQADVLYMTANRVSADLDNLAVSRRPMLNNAFYKSNIYRAKSDSDLLDSGNDSYNGDEEDDIEDGTQEIFNRKGFGHLTLFSNKSLLNTMQSFEDVDSHLTNGDHVTPNGLLTKDAKRVSGDGEELIEKAGSDVNSSNKYQMPWDQDDLGNLDDDEEDTETSEHSAVEMFLWSCGLANYFHIFTKEEIDVALLMDITDKELQELGLPFGPRKKLKEAIARRKNVLAKPSRMEASQL